MRFPILIRTPAHVQPRASLYYELAANGTFQVRDTPIYRAVTHAVGPIPGLAPESEHLELRCPRLPRGQIEETLAFFAEVYRRYGSEAVVLLFYSPDRLTFRAAAPPQVLVGRRDSTGRQTGELAVRYSTIDRPPGFLRLGTIHSHADLPAYPSHADAADEQYEDGLHIVFGHFGRVELSVTASFVTNGVRFQLDPADVLEPCLVPTQPARSDWMAQIRLEEEAHDDDASTCPFWRQLDQTPLPAAGGGRGQEATSSQPIHPPRESTREHTARRRGG